MKRLALAGAVLASLVLTAPAAALDDGLARTPPMGWNGWYAFGCANSERKVGATVAAIVRSGMARAGYNYVDLDDCWMGWARGRDGALRPDPVRFPHGIDALARYVHRRGLKLGIYLSAGKMTCEGRPGSAGHLEQDARTVAGWGVDLVKLDWCYTNHSLRPHVVYAQMRDALRATGRPVLLSISDWGEDEPWTWGSVTGHMWRTSHDIGSADPHNRWNGMLRVTAVNIRLGEHAGPGAWNDPDILSVGLGRMTATEGRTMFSLWSMMAAPLLAGNDLTRMDAATRRTLLNGEIIRVDQDPDGRPATRVFAKSGRDVYVRPLHNGDRVIVLVNRTGRLRHFGVDLNAAFGGTHASRFRARDLWEHRTHTMGRSLTINVSRHGAAVFRVSPPR